MLSKRIRTILLIRFFGYVLFLTGLLGLIAFFAPIIAVEIGYRYDNAVGTRRVAEQINPIPTASPKVGDVGFGEIKNNESIIVPVSTDFGIVIEKINANAKVVKNVDPGSEKAYSAALKIGVAHAKGTNFPGEKGNIYLFSHSTDAPWNIIRYNAIFYLLRELEPGDKVVMFYEGRRFDYIIFDKHVVNADETSYLTNKYDKSILTLQTCDPPGTLFKRLIIRAKLQGS